MSHPVTSRRVFAGAGPFQPRWRAQGRQTWPTHSGALVVEHWPEGTCHFHQFFLSL